MVTISKTNPAPTPVGAKVQPDVALRRVVQLGKVVHQAALDFCWAGAFFILLVNYFKDGKDKGFMSKSDASDYLEKQLREQTGVKNRMLANYITTMLQLSNALTSNSKMFGSYLKALAEAPDMEAGCAILAGWFEKEKGRKIESMRQLMEALGESRPKQVRVQPQTVQKQAERIATTIGTIETKAAEKGSKAQREAERAIVNAVVEKVQSKITLVVEAIKRLTNEAELDTIILAAQTQKKELKALTAKANAAVKERTAAASKIKASLKTKGRTKAIHASA